MLADSPFLLGSSVISITSVISLVVAALVTMSPRLDADFISALADVGAPAGSQFPWYRGAIIALGALNYPEEIPSFYSHVLSKYIPEEEQKLETQKILEGLTKASGIVGAAKVFRFISSSTMV
jgi:hypothetical protein